LLEKKGFQNHRIVRGDELHDKIATNPTLQFAQKHGMQFEFVSREEYRLKAKVHFRNLKKKNMVTFTSFLGRY
jgi:1-aminocyclopropane-1-carboxylate deaminase